MTSAEDRINHVISHACNDFNGEINDICVRNLLTGAGNRAGSLSILESYAHVMGIYSWFVTRDLASLRNWFFTMASMQLAKTAGMTAPERRHSLSLFSASISAFSNCANTYRAMAKVLKSLYSESDNVPLLRILSIQAGFILEGNVSAARDALDSAIAGPPAQTDPLSPDISVFVNLHHGSDSDLQSSIVRLCELGDKRSEMENGYTEGLVNTPATFYTKLCLMAGRNVEVRHPMIPDAWLTDDPKSKPVFRFPQLNDIVF